MLAIRSKYGPGVQLSHSPTDGIPLLMHFQFAESKESMLYTINTQLHNEVVQCWNDSAIGLGVEIDCQLVGAGSVCFKQHFCWVKPSSLIGGDRVTFRFLVVAGSWGLPARWFRAVELDKQENCMGSNDF